MNHKKLVFSGILFGGWIIGIIVANSIIQLKNNGHRASIALNSSVYPSVTQIPTPQYVPQPVSFHSLFTDDHLWTATLSAERITTVIATGDVLTARAVNGDAVKQNNFTFPFEQTAVFLNSADLTIINLETPLVEKCPVTYTGMVFCGDVRNVEGLIFAGIDAVNLANNHMGNWGQDGVDTTVAVLSNAGIVPFGQENPVYINIEGKIVEGNQGYSGGFGGIKNDEGDRGYLMGNQRVLRVALLGYNDIGRQTGVSHISDGTFEQDIQTAKENADMVIVSVHWGVEYTHQPTDRQIEIAHKAVDAGADLVIGNHPHWIQPAEIYNNGLIVYAHGNFIFDQTWSQKTQEGMIGKYTFYDDVLIDAQLIPVVIEGYGNVRFADQFEAEKILLNIK